MDALTQTPPPPYYAVIFTSRLSGQDTAGYHAMAARMQQLAAEQPGYLGFEAAHDEDGLGISVSYWKTTDAIEQWRQVVEHLAAQKQGRDTWYSAFEARVCKVERAYGFAQTT